ncbi:dihydrofolate synthase [Starmerella bacillaris]|uniref:Dihydrofolate synthase n=1 Tax=Starmerella bacillaris TaxID=1247836 RepID=A0AAV5RL49_STABA|nr:dihydrofolate synthase [Starmerella bacillaris]
MISLGLGRIEKLVQKLGNPLANLKVFHVAGTNGKGSVCTYIESILAQSGRNVGKFTSPHLVRPNDAICINKKPVDLKQFQNALEYVKLTANRFDIPATEFELQTATAFTVLANSNIDVGVIEVGLGGLEDATNVLRPENVLCSVITHISLDHESFLGSTVESVAMHKAGIIKQGVPAVVDAANNSDVLEVLRKQASTKNAPFILTKSTVHNSVVNNQAVAELAYRTVFESTSKSNSDSKIDADIKLGLENAEWPGRLQWVGPNLLLDGAHNAAGAQQLRKYIDQHCKGKPVRFVVAFSKPCQKILAELVRPEDSLVATEFKSVESMPWIQPRSLDIVALEAANYTKNISFVDSIHNLSALPKYDGLTVICGSLYLIGDFLGTK